MEHDEAWQQAQVEQGLAADPWFRLSRRTRIYYVAGYGLAIGLAAGGSVGGLAYASGDDWLPVGLVFGLAGLLIPTPLLFMYERYAKWVLRQKFVTDETLRRGAVAFQRSSFRNRPSDEPPTKSYWDNWT